MHLPKFKYFRMSSRAEAARLLKEYGSQARLVAGGTDLYPRMKYGLVCPEAVISLKGMSVKSPEVDESGHLHIDPLMTMADLGFSTVIRSSFPALADAAVKVASGQVRNMATLGGNICLENRCLYYNQSHTFQFVEPCFKRGGNHCYLFPNGQKCFAVFVADSVPALISLGATITLTDGEDIRSLPLQELYTGDALRPLDLHEGEILAEVLIPAQKSLCGMAFVKFSLRGAVEFAALNLAVVLMMDDNGQDLTGARLTLGAVAQAPVRLQKTEAALKGKKPAPGLFHDIAHLAATEVVPMPHHGYSSAYLKKCLEVLTRRALEAAFANIRSQDLKGVLG